MAPLLSDRCRIMYVGTVLSMWLFTIDGVNYSVHWEDDTKDEGWAKFLLLLSGYCFCFGTLTGCILLLVWAKPKMACLLVVLSSACMGALRLVAVRWWDATDSELQS